MTYHVLTDQDKATYNALVSHPLQSWEWGEFRQSLGIEVIRVGLFANNQLKNAFQMTFHKIPLFNFSIGYLPKGPIPNADTIETLKKIGAERNCIFIQIEPNILTTTNYQLPTTNSLRASARPLFTKYTFHLDLTRSEDELLKQMSSKTRYNVRLAQKHGVAVQEENTEKAFNRYLELTALTAKRQGFYAHNEKYHRTLWNSFSHQLTTHRPKADPPRAENPPAQSRSTSGGELTTHLLTARYRDKILVTWILFLFNNVLYYPYGASSDEHREVMASNLMMWEAIHFGKKHGARLFDLWGTPGPDPAPTDPYYGFHRFKTGYGPKLVEFVGSYDLVLKQPHYKFLTFADKLRWFLLKLKANSTK